MVAAKPSRIRSERCYHGIKEINVATPKANAPVLAYKLPDQIQPGDQPKVMDPLERTQIYVQNSSYRGEGLFAKKRINKDHLIVYYSGLLWNFVEQPLYSTNQTDEQR